jgi:GT2 family glycosyltransferase
MVSGVEENGEQRPVRILAIIVVYKASPLLTPSFLTLQRAREAVPSDRVELKTLLYDNTGDGQNPGVMPDGVEYFAASQNDGLSHAYNQGLRMAASKGCDWLLTLDQDSTLPENFLLHVNEIAPAIRKDLSIAAIVPLITESGKTHSPYWFFAGTIPRYYAAGTVVVSTHDTYAFNSASMLRVAALIEVGGYNPWFWLDYSDGYIFRQLHRHRKRVFIAGDVAVIHNYASSDLESRVTLSRYRNMRLAESAFWDLEMGVLAGLERTLGLAVVMLRHILFRDFLQYQAITFEFLKRRLFWTRKKRLEAWRAETLRQFPRLSQTPLPPFV